MRPPNGRYTFHCVGPSGVAFDTHYIVSGFGLETGSFGTLPWVESAGQYELGSIAARCLGYDPVAGTGSGIGYNGGVPYTFTCKYDGP